MENWGWEQIRCCTGSSLPGMEEWSSRNTGEVLTGPWLMGLTLNSDSFPRCWIVGEGVQWGMLYRISVESSFSSTQEATDLYTRDLRAVFCIWFQLLQWEVFCRVISALPMHGCGLSEIPPWGEERCPGHGSVPNKSAERHLCGMGLRSPRAASITEWWADVTIQGDSLGGNKLPRCGW